jgi:eukaryotic-like serine/threonine-protein kinase
LDFGFSMDKPARSSDVPPPSVEEFLKTVVRSGLIDREQLLDALRGFPTEQRNDALAMAEHLVRIGKLSRFQARKLLQGVSKGLILGSFQILSLIGKGGMGRVYLARDSRTNQLMALKVLPPKLAREKERLLMRFQREMELSKKVNHPHVCRTFETDLYRGVHYLAMEFIPGQTLTRLINTEGPMEVPRLARLLAEVASGLEHAHQQGLVHRDLKPGNIMITPHDHAKLLDLGLALMAGEKADPSVTGGQGYVVGTMDYIAPEQTTDAAGVDGRADIYSLGCTSYFALTGRPPFPGGTSIEKIHRHRKEEPESLLKLRPTMPPAFAALIHRMLAKDPRHRFTSARAAEEKLWMWAEAVAAEPLDAVTDPTFTEAVEAIKREEPPTDGSWTDLDLMIDTAEAAEAKARDPAPEDLLANRLLRWSFLGLAILTTLVLLIGGLIQGLKLFKSP